MVWISPWLYRDQYRVASQIVNYTHVSVPLEINYPTRRCQLKKHLWKQPITMSLKWIMLEFRSFSYCSSRFEQSRIARGIVYSFRQLTNNVVRIVLIQNPLPNQCYDCLFYINCQKLTNSYLNSSWMTIFDWKFFKLF